MLYKRNSELKLSGELFKNPTSEYRGTPFWAWNSYLEKDELCRQIDIFNEMGLGGFHMHVRTGLENEYLSDEYMQLVKDCVDKAKENKMLAWLYDEDRWPSGAAGGIVTKNKSFRQRSICFSADYDKTVKRHKTERDNPAMDDDTGIDLLTCYDIVLDDDGYLVSYNQIGKDDVAKGKKWYVFSYVETSNSWYNDQTYIDTLNPEAVKEFVNVTHERYKEVIGDDFDETVPAIFTDEPQVSRKQQIGNSFDCDRDIFMPWTDRLPEEYEKRYGISIFEHLPEIIWQLPESVNSPHRYNYHNLIGDLFTDSFAKVIGEWCSDNKIAFTGHLMEEPTLESQTHSLSEAMRSYGYFGIPGIDLLCNREEFTTAKQCQSAVHQYGKEGMLSELYGVTAWDADFRLYKYSGDWQAALGVTVRVPHLSWYAMKGEAKRDYPASISYQSPWYKKYHLVEDHFARLNTALTRGKPVVKVGVIHPIESYWLHYGPNDKTELFRRQLEEQFDSVTNWLLEGSIDFDFISESLLPSLNETASNPLKVGKMEYDAVIVPGCETLRSTTVEKLNSFREAGGKLIFMGSSPKYCDALVSDKPAELYKKSENIGFTRGELLASLENYRTLTIRYQSGKLAYNYIYQLRKDNDCSWLFICHKSETDNKEVTYSDRLAINVAGEFKAELWDTTDGKVYPAEVSYKNGNTVIYAELYAYDSVLLRLVPGKAESSLTKKYPDMNNAVSVEKCDSFEIDEDNVLVLDFAEFKVDDGEYQPREEILRLDNKARVIAGLRYRSGGVVQPYAVEKIEANNSITLKFSFESEIEYSGAYLALEDADIADISFNGVKVENEIKGWFVDKVICKVAIPEIKKGVNTLIIKLPLGERTNTENVFILGKFGVKITGQSAKITAFPEKVYFGDIVSQGLPFYGGNISYKFKAETKEGKLAIKASYYRGTLMMVLVDGEEIGDIIYPPYIVCKDGLTDGVHDVEIKLYGNRYNCFGPLHLCDLREKWHGPGAWRSEGSKWCYEYVLRQIGLLGAPVIK